MHLDKLNQLKQNNKKIAVIGLGKENQQFLEWLLLVFGYPSENIVLADKLENPLTNLNLENNLLVLLEKSKNYFGEKYLDCLKEDNLEWVFKAPGIHSLRPEFVEFRNKKGNWAVTSSLIFFLEKFSTKIIGITGTKGKSTTSSLINFMVNKVLKLEAEYCGNTTGVSPYSFWKEINYQAEANKYWVIELSSFQLQDIGFAKISPERAVITNYYIDHLDQHFNVKEYWLAKDQIFCSPNTFLIANEQIKLHSQTNLEGRFLITADQSVLLTKDLKFTLPGQHNILNLAEGLAVIANIDNPEIKTFEAVKMWVEKNINKINLVLPNFQNLPHRFEIIKNNVLEVEILSKTKKLNIIWVDDGYATESDAVAAAIKSVPSKFGNFLWLWLAGKDKGSDLKVIVDAIFEKQLHSELYGVEYCGEVGKRVLTELYSSVGTNQVVGSVKFKESVTELLPNISKVRVNFENWLKDLAEELKMTEQDEVIQELAALDEINLYIVFSPSGSSFDEFKNAGERADWWTNWVNGLGE